MTAVELLVLLRLVCTRFLLSRKRQRWKIIRIPSSLHRFEIPFIENSIEISSRMVPQLRNQQIYAVTWFIRNYRCHLDSTARFL
jgi:hypothetical protein